MNDVYDCIVIGGGPAGILASISCANEKNSVLLLEKLPKIAAKLKATGGGKCNLTNTLSTEEFMAKFGKNGRFMSHALELFNASDLRDFFAKIGVETIARDGFRVFPVEHNSSVILSALAVDRSKLCLSTRLDCPDAHGQSWLEVRKTEPAVPGLGWIRLGQFAQGGQDRLPAHQGSRSSVARYSL